MSGDCPGDYPPDCPRAYLLDCPREVTAASDLIAATAALTQAVASGDLTPSEGADISRMVTSTARAIEVVELEDRIRKLEEAQSAK
jgi:hypothetical protein